MKLLIIAALAVSAYAACNNPTGWQTDNLETKYMPVLDADASGFVNKDAMTIFFDNPNKFTLKNDPTIYGNPETFASHGTPAAGHEDANADCYTRHSVTSDWTDMVGNCNAYDANDALGRAQTCFTCKLHVENEEDLTPIRGEALTRDVISEMPYIVCFPKQVESHLHNISVFAPPNVEAALIRQEVEINVSDLGDLSAEVDIFTSLQWPFRCKSDAATFSATSMTADIGIGSIALTTDCVAHTNVPDPLAQPGDELACNQIWTIDLDVANGAATAPCELDGNYRMQCEVECQPTFASDCPLVGPDGAVAGDIVTVDFTLDSENFCPTVVEDVGITATLEAFKDHDHLVPASNYISGQTIYFVAEVSSPKVSITHVTVDHISLNVNGGMPIIYQATTECDANDVNAVADAVKDLVVEDGHCENGENYQAWFQWEISDSPGPFSPPVDGSDDFDVWVTLNVHFDGVSAPLLLQVQESYPTSGQQAQKAANTFGFAQNENSESSAAIASSLVAGALVAANL